MARDTARDASLPSSQNQEDTQIPVLTLSFLCVFSIQTSGFSMANSSQSVAGSTPLIGITLLSSLRSVRVRSNYPTTVFKVGESFNLKFNALRHKVTPIQRTLFSIGTLIYTWLCQGVVVIHFGRPFKTVYCNGFCSCRSQLDPELLHGCLRYSCLRTTPGKTMVEKAVALCLKERALQPASEVSSLVAFARSLHFCTPFPVAGVWSLHYMTEKRKGLALWIAPHWNYKAS